MVADDAPSVTVEEDGKDKTLLLTPDEVPPPPRVVNPVKFSAATVNPALVILAVAFMVADILITFILPEPPAMVPDIP